MATEIDALLTAQPIGWIGDAQLATDGSYGVSWDLASMSIVDKDDATDKIVMTPGGATPFDVQVGGSSKTRLQNTGIFQWGGTTAFGFGYDGSNWVWKDGGIQSLAVKLGAVLIGNGTDVLLHRRNAAGALGLFGTSGAADGKLFIHGDYSDVGSNPTNWGALTLTCDGSGDATILSEASGTPGDLRLGARATKITIKPYSAIQLSTSIVPNSDGAQEIGQDASSFKSAAFNQGTNDDGFINFRATADADATSAISTLTTSGATTHHIQIEINGTKAWIAASTNAPS